MGTMGNTHINARAKRRTPSQHALMSACAHACECVRVRARALVSTSVHVLVRACVRKCAGVRARALVSASVHMFVSLCA